MSLQVQKPDQTSENRLDRPSNMTPTIDAPWESPAERVHRMTVTRGDRSSHRAYHSLYEDMLN